MPLSFSFEFFPPKNGSGNAKLLACIDDLSQLAPAYMTVTYGAGGSTRERTLHTARQISQITNIPTGTHLTYINTTIPEIERIADELWQAGIRHIVALRGDMPQDLQWPLNPDADYFQYTDEFVRKLKSIHPFDISVGAYPEKHPDAPDLSADIDALRKKCAAGADRAITQFFFDNQIYYDFVDQCQANGITTPIIPGILPITNITRMIEFAKTCNASIPQSILDRFANAAPPDHDHIAAEILTTQCADLLDHGVTHFHFYTLNQAPLTRQACQALQDIYKQNPS